MKKEVRPTSNSLILHVNGRLTSTLERNETVIVIIINFDRD